jgi:hypothetical protein
MFRVTPLASHMTLLASRVTLLAIRVTLLASRVTLLAIRVTLLASRVTPLTIRLSPLASEVTPLAIRVMLYRLRLNPPTLISPQRHTLYIFYEREMIGVLRIAGKSPVAPGSEKSQVDTRMMLMAYSAPPRAGSGTDVL